MKPIYTSILTALFTIALFVFTSCEKDIEFKGEITKPMLVLNSIVNPDSVVTVHLSQSRFVLGKIAPIPNVEDASVKLHVNGAKKEMLTHKGSGVYKGSYMPKPLDEIWIEVEAPGFEKIEAKAIVPEEIALKVESITEERKTIPSFGGGSDEVVSQLVMKLSLTDDGSKENFYFVKGRRKTYYEGKLLYSDPLNIKLSDILDNDKVVGEGDMVSGSLWESDSDNEDIKNIFNDVFINGKELGLHFVIHEMPSTDPTIVIEYEIEVAQMAKDLYLYIVSSNKAMKNDGIPIVEATQVHSNVTNKVGILGTFNSSKVIKRI